MSEPEVPDPKAAENTAGDPGAGSTEAVPVDESKAVPVVDESKAVPVDEAVPVVAEPLRQEPEQVVGPDTDEASGETGVGGDASDSIRQEIKRRTRRSLIVGGVASLAGLFGFRWLTSRRDDDGVPWPLRRALEVNEGLAEEYFSPVRLAPTFPASAIQELRANGDVGLGDDFDPASWSLSIENVAGRDAPVALTIDDLRAMPATEMITEFKCIEGWSRIVQWKGVRLSDLMRLYPPPTLDGDSPDFDRPDRFVRYVAMETPDGVYYVGLDMASALHPQTLLSYEINGQPLPREHGAPLRLTIPVKYGIKNIKRIGVIRYTDRRPRDFWAESGYDWYSGH